jgi:16S rRNA (adenine1518-N6/adenine1519-N6)-dimethyltransferase
MATLGNPKNTIEILNKYQFMFQKRFGQNFLIDTHVLEKIIKSAEITKEDLVLEIGPGMGVLTQYLLNNPLIDLNVVEIDRESVDYLQQNFKALAGRIISDDFLKISLDNIFDGADFCVIGNYPYNISSQIFFKVLEYRDRIPICSGMIQKEVAERIASKPNQKSYGILSVLLQAFYDIEYLFTVHEHVFDPPPKVKSAVIRMKRNGVKELGCDEVLFVKVVKMAFNQRRKMLRNSLQGILGKDNPVFAEIVFTKRPEQLSVFDFIDLTNLVQKSI